MKNNTGAFIVIEGVDGVGKTEQAKLLINALTDKGLKVIPTKTPGEVRNGELFGSCIGPPIRRILFGESYTDVCYESKSLLLLADHIQMIEEVVKPAIANNSIVISDRFMDSQFAAWGRSMDDKINQTFLSFYTQVPDLTIHLIDDPEVCFYRANHRSESENRKQSTKPWSTLEGLTSIQDRYKELFENVQDVRTIKTVDAKGLSIEEVHNKILEVVTTWLKSRTDTTESPET